MQSEYFSGSQSGDLDSSLSDNDHAMGTGFSITHKDAGILQQYLDEFQAGDLALQMKIIEKAMAEIYRLQLMNSPFDKKEARKVC
jgi:hypothetical protein